MGGIGTIKEIKHELIKSGWTGKITIIHNMKFQTNGY